MPAQGLIEHRKTQPAILAEARADKRKPPAHEPKSGLEDDQIFSRKLKTWIKDSR
jgi:hypothetical protein